MEVELGARPEPKPTGTVTFLFSDVEGSTARWERNRSAMEAAVRLHDAIVRAAIVEHHGHVFKTVGDAFCAVFARPDDAIAASLDAQRHLLDAEFAIVDALPVRMALHTGTAEERDDDYFGPTVNRVSRLLAIGNGSQILVSGVTSDLVQGTLPAQAALRDLGEHRLRDLTYPEQVYQLVAPGLPSEFAALRSLEILPNNLPLQLTSFVGRDTEVAEIESLLKKHRVVTIVGSGGVGKTRASLQVGADLLDVSADGVWFVELAPLADGANIPSAIADALRIDASAGVGLERLATALRRKRLLLILDNCEHLVEATARVVDALVRGCPNVSVLASSRQALGIAGEATYRMPSLATPSATAMATVKTGDLKRYGSIALFVERAQAADPRFVLDDTNAAAVAEICRRLDGIAFAIELAAARVRMLSPVQLQRRLDERFRLLTGGSRTALPRQQTLRALINWSHELLDARERTLFRRAGIFVDGFTLEAAAAVCSDAAFDELDLFDVLASLVDKSLVVAELDDAATRYRLLESTRAFALEKLDDAGELRLLADRHLEYFHGLGTGAQAEFQEMSSAEPFEFMLTEQGNIRTAIAHGIATGDYRRAAELAGWSAVSDLPGDVIEAWCQSALAAIDPHDAPLRAWLLTRLAGIYGLYGRSERCREATEEALRIARSLDDATLLFESLNAQSSFLRRARRIDEAKPVIAEMTQLLVHCDTPRFRLQLLSNSGLVAGFSGDLSGASTAYAELLQLCRAHANEKAGLMAAVSFAEFDFQSGNIADAIHVLNNAIPHIRRRFSTEILANALSNMGAYLVAQDRVNDARSNLLEVFSIASIAPGATLFATIALEHTALVMALKGDMENAVRLAAYVEAEFGRRGFQREYTEITTYTRLSQLLEHMSDTDRRHASEEGRAYTAEGAIRLATDLLTSTASA